MARMLPGAPPGLCRGPLPVMVSREWTFHCFCFCHCDCTVLCRVNCRCRELFFLLHSHLLGRGRGAGPRVRMGLGSTRGLSVGSSPNGGWKQQQHWAERDLASCPSHTIAWTCMRPQQATPPSVLQFPVCKLGLGDWTDSPQNMPGAL